MSMQQTASGFQDAAAALRQKFLSGMSFAASTVNVVTTSGAAGRSGVTVSAMSSVSADGEKPTLLVCVHHMSQAASAIIKNGVFCVNVLRDDQSFISDSFAGRIKQAGGDKFLCTDWVACGTGSPRVADGLVAFDCRLKSQERIGTHHVFIGEVENIHAAERGSPLIYANRAYGTPQALAASAAAAPEALSIGVFHTFGPYLLPEIMSRLTASGFRPELNLVIGDQRQVVAALNSASIDVALLYDFDLPETLNVQRMASLSPYVLLAEAHPLANRQEITLAELQNEPMVLLDAPPSGAYFSSLFEKAGLTPDIRYRLASFETVRGFVAHGLGYTLLTTKPSASMSYDGRSLVARRLADNTEKSHIALVMRKGTELSAVGAAFVAICQTMFH